MAEIVNQIEVWLERSVPESFVPDVRERTAEAFRIRLKPIEGAIDLVRATTGRFCVASSGPVEKIRLNLSLTGLLLFFEGHIFSSYEVGFWKPNRGYFYTLLMPWKWNRRNARWWKTAFPAYELEWRREWRYSRSNRTAQIRGFLRELSS